MTFRAMNRLRRRRPIPPPSPVDAVLAAFALAAVAVMAAGLMALALAIATSKRGHAHEWYPYYCCLGSSVGGDCGPLDPKRVQALDAGGYLVDGRFYIAPSKVQASLDGRFHGCFPAGDLGCFFAPPRGL